MPQKLLYMQAVYNVAVRQQSAYNKRVQELSTETKTFEACKESRPKRKKCANTCFREEAGTETTYIRDLDLGNYYHKACRVKKTF